MTRKLFLLLTGVGIGAGLMYLLDPDRGRRRRALIRDKIEHATNEAEELAGKTSRDLRNRAQGVMAEIESSFTDEDIRNDVLVERVRVAMGRVPGDHSAIEITANKGIVTVGGEASGNDLPDLLAALPEVRGVRDMVSELRVQDEAID